MQNPPEDKKPKQKRPTAISVAAGALRISEANAERLLAVTAAQAEIRKELQLCKADVALSHQALDLLSDKIEACATHSDLANTNAQVKRVAADQERTQAATAVADRKADSAFATARASTFASLALSLVTSFFVAWFVASAVVGHDKPPSPVQTQPTN